MEISELRSKIERARKELAGHEAAADVQKKEMDATKKKLRDLLGCKAGQEKKAITKLQQRVTKNQAKVEALLKEAEEIVEDE